MLKIQEPEGHSPWNPTGALLLDPAARIGMALEGLPPPPKMQTSPLDPALSLPKAASE